MSCTVIGPIFIERLITLSKYSVLVSFFCVIPRDHRSVALRAIVQFQADSTNRALKSNVSVFTYLDVESRALKFQAWSLRLAV